MERIRAKDRRAKRREGRIVLVYAEARKETEDGHIVVLVLVLVLVVVVVVANEKRGEAG